MKKIKIIILISLFSFVANTYAQKEPIDTLKLSNGKLITVYSDNTWKYFNSDETKTKGSMPIKTRQPSTKSANSSNKVSAPKSDNSDAVGVCGARTKSGGSCKRRVKGGGRCYQH